MCSVLGLLIIQAFIYLLFIYLLNTMPDTLLSSGDTNPPASLQTVS